MTDSSQPSTTILVVDDNDSVLNVVVLMLKSARFQVLSATSGPGALQMASDPSVRIDLLLSDIDMPGMSGPTLALLLHQIRPDVRLLFMSGGNHDLPFAETDCAYIAKPFLLEGLIKKIDEAFGRRQLDSVAAGSD
jgi:two-component system cell cycle sensor histidine kinase/response regulator CckA